ncbi:MAG: glyceraldehyde 3-phosphate dehydrogenase NAD-binding domain-containing protein [Methylococcaceae bacterium]|jgi:glyceraldehyde 3-phosphate dehydrogenase
MTLRVGIAGLGRIGRGLLRNNYTKSAEGRFDISIVCDVMPIDQVAYLMANDSTYGQSPFFLDCDGDNLMVNGKAVRYLKVDRRRGLPDEASYKVLREYQLDVFIDATGTATINDLRSLVDQKLAKKIICTSNIEGSDISLVFGINHADYDPLQHHVVTASTCTGNAMVPIAHILEKHFGIDYARIITIHPALADQRVLDSYHSSPQLGRAYAASVLPLATNVAKSTALIIPSLKGKLDSLSYRVPTAIVSIIDFTAQLAKDTSREECVRLFEDYANNSLKGIIQCDYGAWGHERASIDFMGSEFSSILLMNHLVVNQHRHLGVSMVHDNEQAYCCRALDVLGLIGEYL